MLSSKAMMGAPAAVPQYIEDVFSTWLYTGNDTLQTITNGIDLAGKGGMVWVKSRSLTTNNRITDTVRGATKSLSSNLTDAQITENNGVNFTSSGFTVNDDSDYNASPNTYCSWTFREAPKFFDVVTYTGTGANRTVAHNLGAVPGMIIVKNLSAVQDWAVYHRSLGNQQRILLNSTSQSFDVGSLVWNATDPTATNFSLGTNTTVNANGNTYVAYLFAHDAGGFGEAGDQNVVSCGTYNGNGSDPGRTITLGYEPQFLMIKNAAGTGNWQIIDNMRGMSVGSADATLQANLSNAESAVDYVSPLATGFQITSTSSEVNTGGEAYIYLAIRRGPMKTPTVGTSVFAMDFSASPTAQAQNPKIQFYAGFPVDYFQQIGRGSGGFRGTQSRLAGDFYMQTSSTAGEVAGYAQDVQLGVRAFTGTYSTTSLAYMFRRAPGFFDVVCYTGTSVARTVNHNLGVAPELMIVKRRSASENWPVYSKNNATEVGYLDLTNAFFEFPIWNNTAPTSSVFSVGTPSAVNASGSTYVAYLFATVPNVSKVGSYTGTGGTQTINAGLPTGARFVLIKRTNSTGNWWVWDTARGMVSGTDPRLALNTTAAELNNNWVYTIANGFQIVTTDATINASGGSYIYLAIA